MCLSVMADTLDLQAERGGLSAEAVCRVRALRNKIDAEDEIYVAAAEQLLAPVRARFRRHPQRNFRPEMLAALEKSWHLLPSTYRLACQIELSKDSLTVNDIAISAANLECTEWIDGEPSFVIAETTLIMRRGIFHVDCVVTYVVSLHAAARRLSTTSEDDLLDDLRLLARHDGTEIPEGQSFVVHTNGGLWRGRCVRMHHGGPRTLSVQTWLPE